MLSFQEIREKLANAIRTAWPNTYYWVRDVYDDFCIVESYDNVSTYYKITYTADKEAGTVAIGNTLEKMRMVVDYLPLSEAFTIHEAMDESGKQWNVVLIEPGTSKNGYHYSAAVLQASVNLFEGVRALSRSDADHLKNDGKSVENIVGWYDNIQYVEGTGIVGTFHITEDADWLRLKIRSAWDQGKKDLVQFSIVASGSGKRQLVDGQLVMMVEGIDHVEFVDTVVDASAGGRILSLVASVSEGQQRELNMLQTLLKMLEAQRPDLYAKIDVNNVTEEQVTAMLTEALQTPTAPPTPPTPITIQTPPRPVVAPPAPAVVATVITEATAPVAGATAVATPTANMITLEQVQTLLRESAAQQAQTYEQQMAQLREATAATQRTLEVTNLRTVLRESLASCPELPEVARVRIRNRFQGVLDRNETFTATQLAEAIREEREYLGSLHSSGAVTGFGPGVASTVQMGEAAEDKANTMLDDFFTKKPGSHSFKECYIAITGDRKITGKIVEAVNLSQYTRLRESLNTGVFDQVFADAMNRQLVREYTRLNLRTWGSLVDIVPVADFRTRHRIRIGGYANLDIVLQGQPYPALVSPTDEEATYAVVKRGGTEDLTLEMIRNDDVSAIRLIPLRMARAATQTLHEFVFNFLANNPTIYDSVALFHANHANLNTTAFSAAEYMVLRRKMRSQTEKDNNKPIGILPRNLFIPNTLEEAAYNAFRQDTNLEPRLVATQQVRPNIVVVDYWTDADNWFATASTDQTPMIELAFLDGNEDPEMFVQDMPEVGSMFTNDKRTYKIRHTYGGAIVDYRGFQGAIVP